MILGVDTGGTFTDFALITHEDDGQLTLTTHKVLSTLDAPERAILQGIHEMGLAETMLAGNLKIIHGSTVATNAVLEGKGVSTAFVTNRGFKDLLTIARQTRPELYHLESPPLPEPVPDELCLEIGGRLSANGETIEALTTDDMRTLVERLELLKPQAIAINLLFSFLDNSHEVTLENYLQQHLSWKPYICRSSFVLPEHKEYERGIATWLNASLGPLVETYLLNLKAQTAPSPLSIMQSSGGTISAQQASKKSVNLLLSGPAGGLAAANFLAKTLKQPRLMTFDMGGTSTDVALIEGKITLTNEGRIGSFPIAVPMVDMHTIGAGGGSIAYVDQGGLLQVGPQSAGANPGPACYGQGGNQATVTDANLVLGRLLPEAFMRGSFSLNIEAAHASIKAISDQLALTSENAADGIIRIANEHMARALRVISIGRGHDPREFRLCCFGGAGGLHICTLAKALEMKSALVPVQAGVLSALGMLLAPVERQLSRSHQCLLENVEALELEMIIAELKEEGIGLIQTEGLSADQVNVKVSADLRYLGQATCLNLDWCNLASLQQNFHKEHNSRYGHHLSEKIELVNIRVAVRGDSVSHELAPLTYSNTPPTPTRMTSVYGYVSDLPVYSRDDLKAGQRIIGPALIIEATSTTLIEAAWTAEVDNYGNLFLEND
ncbi:hydantoinase/oxoprolinase family protein [Gammaproteobacteria bacterium]|nr:hydantoinase/oxoprolinase family protein [Gammaproteobacteria bacterium]